MVGRVRQLECLVMAVFGTVAFEINRMIIAKLGFDVVYRGNTAQEVYNDGIDRVGTYSIFTFGAFMGLSMGIVLAFR